MTGEQIGDLMWLAMALACLIQLGIPQLWGGRRG